jgi:hypothetical protein
VILAAILSIFAVMGRARAAQPISTTALYCIGVDRVAAALVARGIPVQPDQVEFLAPIKSSRPDPALEIERLQAGSRDSVLARIRCRNAGECLPFYIVLHPSGKQDAQEMIELLHATAGPIHAAGSAVRPNWAVRSGERATFVLQGRDFRASTPVICLENGRQGESIRARSLDRKRIMVGEVVGPGLLRGAL